MSEGLGIGLHEDISVTHQLDQETTYFADCQKVVHQLVKGGKSACLKGCASDSLKASPQGISRVFTRYYLYNIDCLQDICVSSPRANIPVDKQGAFSTCSLVVMNYRNNYTIDRTFCQTAGIFDIYHSSYPYSGSAYISNCSHT